MRAPVAALTIIIALTSHVLAWGDEGHRIAAEIAEQYLKAGTAHQVRELLALEIWRAECGNPNGARISGR
jgi:hypothetical protein